MLSVKRRQLYLGLNVMMVDDRNGNDSTKLCMPSSDLSAIHGFKQAFTDQIALFKMDDKILLALLSPVKS